CFGRPLSLKQLVDGAYLIGGGWPARVPDEALNRWEVLDDSVRGSLEVARAVYPPLAARSVAQELGRHRSIHAGRPSATGSHAGSRRSADRGRLLGSRVRARPRGRRRAGEAGARTRPAPRPLARARRRPAAMTAGFASLTTSAARG